LCTRCTHSPSLVMPASLARRRLPRARPTRRRARSRRGQSSPVDFAFNQLARQNRGELLKFPVPSVWSLPCRGRRTARALASSAAPCHCVRGRARRKPKFDQPDR
jgi:hypothetical protein